MRFLEKHIEHAWIDTINSYNLIMDGLTDLTARKNFVSSLQNAIELIFKQYLIDKNDHSVIEWKLDKNKKRKWYHKLFGVTVDLRKAEQITFENEKDLNTYFISNPKNANKLFTISFDKLIDKIFDLIRTRNSSFDRSGLRLLKNLRNNETHFFIDDSFLTFEEFIELRKLIKDIYNFLEFDSFLGFFGLPLSADKDTLKYFDYYKMSSKSYLDLIKKSQTNKDILNLLVEYSPIIPHGIAINYCNPDDIFSIAFHLFKLNIDEDGIDIPVKLNLYEFYRRFDLLNQHKFILISDDSTEWEDENGNSLPQMTFVSRN